MLYTRYEKYMVDDYRKRLAKRDSLLTRISDVTKALKTAKSELKKIEEEIKTIADMIRLVSPHIDLDQVKPTVQPKRIRSLSHERLVNSVRTTLRTAKTPLTTNEIVERVAALRGLKPEDTYDRDVLKKAVLASLHYLKTTQRVAPDDAPGNQRAWSLVKAAD